MRLTGIPSLCGAAEVELLTLVPPARQAGDQRSAWNAMMGLERDFTPTTLAYNHLPWLASQGVENPEEAIALGLGEVVSQRNSFVKSEYSFIESPLSAYQATGIKPAPITYDLKTLGSVSQSIKIHLNLRRVVFHSDFYCDITFCFAIKIDTQLRSILTLCESDPWTHLVIVKDQSSHLVYLHICTK